MPLPICQQLCLPLASASRRSTQLSPGAAFSTWNPSKLCRRTSRSSWSSPPSTAGIRAASSAPRRAHTRLSGGALLSPFLVTHAHIMPRLPRLSNVGISSRLAHVLPCMCSHGRCAETFLSFAPHSSSGDWQPCLKFMQPLTLGRARGHRGVAPHNHGKSGGRSGQCDVGQLRALDDFSGGFMRRLTRSPALHRRGCGAFLHGCHSHCPGRLDRFVIGRVTLDAAMLQWWRSDPTTPAAAHTHIGCLTQWADGDGAMAAVGAKGLGAIKECKPSCSPLYPWPDERKRIAERSLGVERAIRAGVPSTELCRAARAASSC